MAHSQNDGAAMRNPQSARRWAASLLGVLFSCMFEKAGTLQPLFGGHLTWRLPSHKGAGTRSGNSRSAWHWAPGAVRCARRRGITACYASRSYCMGTKPRRRSTATSSPGTAA